MKKIQLLTNVGRHVAYVEILPFPPDAQPRVVLWGTRVFVRDPSGGVSGADAWFEAFAVASLTPAPGLDGDGCPRVATVDRAAQTTTDGRPVDEVRAEQREQGNRMHDSYIVLTDEERAKGFVRPVRKSYRHLKCGSITTMGAKIAETYARSPDFYGSTMCVACGSHFPVGADGEFLWDGSTEKVGT